MNNEIIAVIRINCFAACLALSKVPCPTNCAATTAPPVAKAANILIKRILIPSTKETAETAASPTLATITVSKKPTKITNNCSITSGTINLFKSLLVNNTHNRPLHRPIIRLSILDSKLFLFLKHKNYFNLAHNSIKQLSSKGLKYFCTNKLSGVKL